MHASKIAERQMGRGIARSVCIALKENCANENAVCNFIDIDHSFKKNEIERDEYIHFIPHN